MRPSPERRIVILAEGHFGPHHGKTAMGVLRYGRDTVVAVIDSTKAGRRVGEVVTGLSGERGDVPIDVLVEHVLIHEIGHHIGMSDDDMDAIEARAEEESRRVQPGA